MEARAKIVESATGWSEKVWAAFAEMGLLGVPFAEEHGGFGGSAVDVMLVMEALGEGLVVEPYWVNVGLAGRLVARAGSEAQQKRILPALIQGKQRLAFAHTERTARYDLAHVGTRAKRAGAGYTLDGEKRAVLHGGAADTLIVSARTGGGDADATGISLFLVDRSAPGVTLKEYRTIDELRAADVWLSGVSVPAEARLGDEGRALPLIEDAADYATALLCAEAVGAIRFANEATLEYIKTRRQFGVPIGSFQALQHRMVDMVISYEQARSMACLACVKVDTAPAGRAAPRGLRGQDQGGGRLPAREPGGGAAPRGHGHDRGAEGEPHLPAAHHDRPDLRGRRAPPGALRRRRQRRLTAKRLTRLRLLPL